MQTITTTDYHIYFEDTGYDALTQLIKQKKYASIFILTDENTKAFCYPKFCSKIAPQIVAEVMTIPAGEIHKNIDTCIELWQKLTQANADRYSLLINLGGGVITDLGGFVAATYKRGIDFVNIPTTLLAMVDASIGGKTGVDLGILKNQVGAFANPVMIVNDTEYLQTLPKRELHSGLAEIIKYGLTYDITLFDKIKQNPNLKYSDLIPTSVMIKNRVVSEDPKEKHLRKSLNFGHTLGHAIESYFLTNEVRKPLTHGEAIAIGMVCESFISAKLCGFPMARVKEIRACILAIYGRVVIFPKAFADVIDLLKHDKKNSEGKVQFVLLNAIEDCKIDCEVPKELIVDSLQFYNTLKG